MLVLVMVGLRWCLARAAPGCHPLGGIRSAAGAHDYLNGVTSQLREDSGEFDDLQGHLGERCRSYEMTPRAALTSTYWMAMIPCSPVTDRRRRNRMRRAQRGGRY